MSLITAAARWAIGRLRPEQPRPAPKDPPPPPPPLATEAVESVQVLQSRITPAERPAAQLPGEVAGALEHAADPVAPDGDLSPANQIIGQLADRLPDPADPQLRVSDAPRHVPPALVVPPDAARALPSSPDYLSPWHARWTQLSDQERVVVGDLLVAVHVAGSVRPGGRQRCSRCGIALPHPWRGLLAWAKGTPVGQRGDATWPITGRPLHTDEIECRPVRTETRNTP